MFSVSVLKEPGLAAVVDVGAESVVDVGVDVGVNVVVLKVGISTLNFFPKVVSYWTQSDVNRKY